MDHLPKLLNVAPEVEVADGFIYLIYDGRRQFAYAPHTARVANERIRRALDALDAENASKVVAFG